ncbi:MAG TPA: hypothetical protein VGO86_03500 [Candidatus Dormibacteraeota bacterium]
MAGLGVLAAGVTSAATSADLWAPAGPLPGRLDAPVFALAIDPTNGRHVLAGTEAGAILSSTDGGATWRTAVIRLGRGVAALAFDPSQPSVVVAGTRGAGVWSSADGGRTWRQQPGTDSRTVRAFAFAGGVTLAGSDRGVLSSHDGARWSPAGLTQVRVSALAAWTEPDGTPLLAAGGDATQGGEPLPLFVSIDAGQTWAVAPGVRGSGAAVAVAGSSMVTALSPPATPDGALLMATNGGVFATPDRGATWQQLTGSGVLPGTGFAGVGTAPNRPDRLYVASDGGGSERGGVWASGDGGARFVALAPPEPEVTALAVSGDDPPRLVAATFRPADHAVVLWTYRDAGGQPVGAATLPARAASPRAPAAPRLPAGGPGWRAVLAQPETPYAAVGVVALLVVVAALAAHIRRGGFR